MAVDFNDISGVRCIGLPFGGYISNGEGANWFRFVSGVCLSI